MPSFQCPSDTRRRHWGELWKRLQLLVDCPKSADKTDKTPFQGFSGGSGWRLPATEAPDKTDKTPSEWAMGGFPGMFFSG